MAHMQRAGGVSGYKFHQHALARFGLLTKLLALGEHLLDNLLLGLGFEFDVDKPGACNIYRVYPACKRRRCQQSCTQVFSQLAGAALQGLGQLHGSRGGQVPMGDHFG